MIALARTWDDELADILDERHGARPGRTLAAAWSPLFPEHYKGYTKPELAAVDVACFARLDAGESFVVSLHPIGKDRPTRVALYKRAAKIELSRVMPMLEDLGLRVIEEISTRLLGRRGDVGAGVPGARAGRAGARPRRRRVIASPRRSPPSIAATTSPTRSTGS